MNLPEHLHLLVLNKKMLPSFLNLHYCTVTTTRKLGSAGGQINFPTYLFQRQADKCFGIYILINPCLERQSSTFCWTDTVLFQTLFFFCVVWLVCLEVGARSSHCSPCLKWPWRLGTWRGWAGLVATRPYLQCTVHLPYSTQDTVHSTQYKVLEGGQVR